MSYERNSAESRKIKSTASATCHPERLGIPERVVDPVIPNVVPVAPVLIPREEK